MTTVIEETVVLDQELSRFFQIGKQLFDETGNLAMMPTCVVDEHWHRLIEANKIDSFAAEHLGDDIEVTHIEAGGVNPLNWVDRYEATFGPLNPVWFTGENGLNAELYNEYTGGALPDMSWDCTPAFASREGFTRGALPDMSWDCTPAFASKKDKTARG